MSRSEKQFIYFMLIILFFIDIMIFLGVTAPREEDRSPTYSTPTIPQCDKELWDRIREGCDE